MVNEDYDYVVEYGNGMTVRRHKDRTMIEVVHGERSMHFSADRCTDKARLMPPGSKFPWHGALLEYYHHATDLPAWPATGTVTRHYIEANVGPMVVPAMPESTEPERTFGDVVPDATGYLRSMSVEAGIRQFVQNVINLIREHESCSACDDGKREALDGIGLDSDVLDTVSVYVVAVRHTTGSDPEYDLDNLSDRCEEITTSYSRDVTHVAGDQLAYLVDTVKSHV